MKSKKGSRLVSINKNQSEVFDDLYSERIYLLQKQFEKHSRKIALRRRLLVLFVLLSVLFAFLFFSPVFNINFLEVRGTERISFDEVKGLSGINFGEDSIILFNEKNFALKIYTLPYTESVRVFRRFPGTVLVEINEASPVAFVGCKGGYVLISKDGRVLEFIESDAARPGSELESTAAVFEIRGLEVTPQMVGLYLPDSESLENFRTMFSFLSSNKFLDKLKYVDLSSASALGIGVYDLDVNLGNAMEMDYKLKMLDQIISHIGINRKGMIDLSGGSRSFFREFI